MDTLVALPPEIIPSVMMSLSYKSRQEILSHIPLDFLIHILQFASTEHLSNILSDIKQLDESKFQSIFETLKLSKYQLENATQYSIHTNLPSNVKLYYKLNGKIECQGFHSSSSLIDTTHLLWVDVCCASADEIEAVERVLQIEIPSVNEREEIEVSSRYWEKNGITTINSYFTIFENDEVLSETISLILKDNFLVSIRFRDFKSFEELQKNGAYPIQLLKRE